MYEKSPLEGFHSVFSDRHSQRGLQSLTFDQDTRWERTRDNSSHTVEQRRLIVAEKLGCMPECYLPAYSKHESDVLAKRLTQPEHEVWATYP